MILVYDKFVQQYISSEHLGKHPGIFAFLTGSDSYREYRRQVSRVKGDLSRFSDAAPLVSYLVGHYGLSRNKAREFVNSNATHQWKKGDRVDKHCMIIHLNRSLNNILENSEGK